MSNDVERLADMIRRTSAVDATRIAETLIAAGVTLPTPPRATPLEAAAGVLEDVVTKLDMESEWVEGEREGIVRRILTAAVGALSEDDMRGVIESWCQSGYPDVCNALLARLTDAMGN